MSPQEIRQPFADYLATVSAVEHHPYPYFTVSMVVPESFGESAPGQFVMTLADLKLEPYLRRAFSVFDQRKVEDGYEIEIFGKVIGPGTRDLAELRRGKKVPVLGPLGRGFSRPPSAPAVSTASARIADKITEEAKPLPRAAMVAGGIGSAALLLWAKELARAEEPFDFFYGGFGAVDLSLAQRFAELAKGSGGEAIYATENGDRGHRGYITEPLEAGLKGGRYAALYTCGPEGLMARVAALGREYGVPGQAALETEMGCGYGACLGCAVPHQDGRFRLCCKDGPVFDLQEVVW